MDSTLNIGNAFFEQFKKFISENNLIGTTAGVCVGVVTKDMISSFVGDILIPCVILLFVKLNLKSLTKILPVNAQLNVRNFLQQFISWLFILIITFVFMKYAFEKLVGVGGGAAVKTAEPKDTQQSSASPLAEQKEVKESANKNEGFSPYPFPV